MTAARMLLHSKQKASEYSAACWVAVLADGDLYGPVYYGCDLPDLWKVRIQ